MADLGTITGDEVFADPAARTLLIRVSPAAVEQSEFTHFNIVLPATFSEAWISLIQMVPLVAAATLIPLVAGTLEHAAVALLRNATFINFSLWPLTHSSIAATVANGHQGAVRNPFSIQAYRGDSIFFRMPPLDSNVSPTGRYQIDVILSIIDY